MSICVSSFEKVIPREHHHNIYILFIKIHQYNPFVSKNGGFFSRFGTRQKKTNFRFKKKKKLIKKPFFFFVENEGHANNYTHIHTNTHKRARS